MTTGKRHVRKNPLILTSGAAASMARRFETEEPSSVQSTCNNPQRNKNTQLTSNSKSNTPTNDAFEDEIAYSIDALDNIPESKYVSPKTSLDNPRGGVESDEVRIMRKVLGGVTTTDNAGCLQALDLTDWNVHKAIKLVKLKALIRKPGVKDNDMKVRNWSQS